MHCRIALSSLTLLALLCVAAQASAFVMPVTSIDDTLFPTRETDVRLLYATLRAEQEPAVEDAAVAPHWRVEAELVLRNQGATARTVRAVLLDNPRSGDPAAVFVNGALVEAERVNVRQDPAMPQFAAAPGLMFELTLDSEQSAVVRVRFAIDGTFDTYGQHFFDLPSHALGLWADAVADGHFELRFAQRPVALTSTLVGGTVYDEPENVATWNLHEWEPQVPFRAAHLGPWSALLLVATAEECPDPYRVLQWMAGSRLTELDTYLEQFDGSTLTFCANLPLVLHGFVFASDRARSELAAIPFERYLPDRARGPLYVENPGFDESSLSEVEGIYRRILSSRVLSE